MIGLGPGSQPTVEDPAQFEAVDPQAPPGSGGIEAGGVVVQDDRRAPADTEPPERRRDAVRAGQQEERSVVVGIDRSAVQSR